MKLPLDTPTLTLFESALFRTVTTLVVGTDHLLLVDPNWLPEEIDYIVERVTPLREGRRCYLLFTHSDYDHIVGYGRFVDFEVIASAALVTNPGREQVLRQNRDFDDQYYITRDYPYTYPRVDRVVAEEGAQLQLGGETYTFYQAPGHNRDGLLTFNRERGLLIVGDYLSNIEFPYVYHSFADYRTTLAKLQRLVDTGDVRLLITGHGDTTADLVEMHRRIDESYSYLDGLEASVRAGTPYDFAGLMRRYAFPGVMRTFHEANVELMRRELTTA